jgi:tRNA (guanine-N7-)-methyltransferase
VLLPWRRLPHPVDWPAAVRSRAPLHLEVGFGDGRFTALRALAAPDEDFVGLEVSGTSVLRALRRMRRDGVRNVRLLKAPAEIAVRQLFGRRRPRVDHRQLPRPLAEGAPRAPPAAAGSVLPARRRRGSGPAARSASRPTTCRTSSSPAPRPRRSGVATPRTAPPPPEVFETKYALKWREQGKPLYYEVFVLDGATCRPPSP